MLLLAWLVRPLMESSLDLPSPASLSPSGKILGLLRSPPKVLLGLKAGISIPSN